MNQRGGIFLKYAAAILISLACVGLRRALIPFLGSNTPYFFLFPVTLLMAIPLGLGPSLLAFVLGFIATEAWVIHPGSPLRIGGPGFVLFTFFVTCIVIMSLIGRRLRFAESRARADARDLAQARDRVASTLNSIIGGYYALDDQWRFTALNHRAEEHFGRPAAELLGQNIWEATGVPLESEIGQQFRDALAGGQPIHCECASQVRPGTWAELHVYPNCNGLEVYFADITPRKTAEEALRQSKDLLDAILNNTHMMVACLDRDFNFIMVNRAYAYADRRRPEFFTGRNHFDLYPNADNEAIFRDVVETGQPYFAKSKAFEYAEHPERGISYWDWSLIPLQDSEGRVAMVILTLADVTALKQAEADLLQANAQLAEADRLKDEFLAMLAHELRNPLAPVRNSIHILRAAEGRPEVARRQQDIIDRQVEHMARLLDDLLDISRITRGKITIKAVPLVVADVLLHVIDSVMPTLRSRRQVLHFDPPDDDLCVMGDMDRLSQAVGNILINATKYTDEGGQIWLETGREGENAVIRIRDNGMGISPEMLPRVFDLFAQADRSLDRSQGGLGIGLTMVRKIIQLHGGSAEAHSEGLGRGSTFILRLPAIAVPAEEVRVHEMESPCPELRPCRVLVVDDIADSASSLAELIAIWGHQTRAVNSGPAALEEAGIFLPDVVLLDIGLPEMDGYEVARRLREAHAGRPMMLVALTGYGQAQDREAARAAGFDEHLVKPVDLKRLRMILSRSPVMNE